MREIFLVFSQPGVTRGDPLLLLLLPGRAVGCLSGPYFCLPSVLYSNSVGT